MRSRPGGMLAALAAGALLAGCASADELRPVAVGQAAPDYAAQSLAGDTVRLTELRDHVVLLNVWATWCPPCREEMPGLEQLSQAFQSEGLRVVAVSIDGRTADAEIDEFVRDNDINFTILHDPDGRVSRTFRTAGVPESFLLGRDGVLLKRWLGHFDPTSEETRQLVADALRAPGSGRP